MSPARRELVATLTKTRHGHPLATVEGLPGAGADLTPAELRRLAAELVRIADDCERRPTTGKHWRAERRAYPLPTT